MPHSDNRERPKVLQYLQGQNFEPGKVMDVGCGAGNNLEFYQPWWPESWWIGVEAWAPYVERFFLQPRYDELIIRDVREIPEYSWDVDLVIFGDVLEHMPKKDSLTLLNKSVSNSRFVIAALPVIHYPQGHLAGNPYEEHVSEWAYDDLALRGDCVFSVRNETTGSFVFKGAK